MPDPTLHTPERWLVGPEAGEIDANYDPGIIILAHKGVDGLHQSVAFVPQIPSETKERTLERARLISAAPELLEALEKLLPLANWALMEQTHPTSNDDARAYAAACLAIRKATGK